MIEAMNEATQCQLHYAAQLRAFLDQHKDKLFQSQIDQIQKKIDSIEKAVCSFWNIILEKISNFSTHRRRRGPRSRRRKPKLKEKRRKRRQRQRRRSQNRRHSTSTSAQLRKSWSFPQILTIVSSIFTPSGTRIFPRSSGRPRCVANSTGWTTTCGKCSR